MSLKEEFTEQVMEGIRTSISKHPHSNCIQFYVQIDRSAVTFREGGRRLHEILDPAGGEIFGGSHLSDYGLNVPVDVLDKLVALPWLKYVTSVGGFPVYTEQRKQAGQYTLEL